jgi:hypothetical protein
MSVLIATVSISLALASLAVSLGLV